MKFSFNRSRRQDQRERERAALLGDIEPGSGVICFSFGDIKILPVLITQKFREKKEITNNKK